MPKINKNMTIAEVLMLDRETFAVSIWHALHRVPASSGESIEQAAMVHGINADELVDSLNDF